MLGSAALSASALTGAMLGACAPEDANAANAKKETTSDKPSKEKTSKRASNSETTAAKKDTKTQTPKVYFTSDISPEGLLRVWEALQFKPKGEVAVKLSIGEPGGHHFLQPTLIADLVHEVNGTIVECNTAYGGQRSTTESHLQAAKDHGFTDIADVDIMDADGEISIPVKGGKHLDEDIVGKNLDNYDTVISLAHFKGHAMGGFGGALKNCSIGIASANGKRYIHSAGTSTTGWGNPAQDDFIESMAEVAQSGIGSRGCRKHGLRQRHEQSLRGLRLRLPPCRSRYGRHRHSCLFGSRRS